jgi:hypothetical protein
MPIYDGLNNAGVTASKKAGTEDLGQGTQGKQYMENGTATPWGRLEPLLTPDLLKSRYLKGIPMQLKIKDVDGKPFKITDDGAEGLHRAGGRRGRERDRPGADADAVHGEAAVPEAGLRELRLLPAPEAPHRLHRGAERDPRRRLDVFVFPTEWLETANLIHGQLNIIPLAFQGMQGGTGVIGGVNAGSGTAVFFNSLWNRPWVAAMFGITYTAGFTNGLMPKYVNNLIGCVVAMRVLSMIAAAYAGVTSTSLGIDGLSQGMGSPGPTRYKQRMDELTAERALIVKKLKKTFGTKFVVGTV